MTITPSDTPYESLTKGFYINSDGAIAARSLKRFQDGDDLARITSTTVLQPPLVTREKVDGYRLLAAHDGKGGIAVGVSLPARLATSGSSSSPNNSLVSAKW